MFCGALSGKNIGPDLGPNCLQKLSADNTRRQNTVFSIIRVQCTYFFLNSIHSFENCSDPNQLKPLIFIHTVNHIRIYDEWEGR